VNNDLVEKPAMTEETAQQAPAGETALARILAALRGGQKPTEQPIETPSPVANVTFAPSSSSLESQSSTPAASFTNESLATTAVPNMSTPASDFPAQPSSSVYTSLAETFHTNPDVQTGSLGTTMQSSVTPTVEISNVSVATGSDSDVQNQGVNTTSFGDPSVSPVPKEAPVMERTTLTPEENEKARELLGMLTDPDTLTVLKKLSGQLPS